MRTIVLDTLSRRALFMRCFLWAVAVSVFLSLGMAGPKTLKRYRYSAYNCKPESDPCDHDVEMAKGDVWQLEKEEEDLKPMNQFLILEFEVENSQYKNNIGLREDLMITLSIEGRSSLDDEKSFPITINQTHIRKLNCDVGSEWCDKIILFHLSYIDHPIYSIRVFFPDVSRIGFIGDVSFQLATVNQQYTEFTIVVKWLYILMTVEVFFLFRRRMSVLRDDEWIPPQRWMSSVLLCLIFFNDPLCVLDTMWINSSWIVPLVSTLMQVSFAFLLLLLWLLLLGLHSRPTLVSDDEEDGSGSLWKYILVLGAWLATCTLLTWLRMHQVQDPMLTYVSDFPYFPVFQDVLLGMAGLYCFWLIHTILKAREELEPDQPPYVRFVVTLGLSLVVAAFFVAGSLFGALPYAAEGQLVHSRGWHFSAMFAIVNCYCYLMAYLFLPSQDHQDTVYDALYKGREGGSYPDEL